MAITVSTDFTVADQTPLSGAASGIVLPSAGYMAGGRGQLIHPSVGTYDYAVAPDEVENVDGDVFYPPVFAHTQTIGGAVDTMWPGYVRDALVTERWKNGDVGCPIAQLQALWQMIQNHPDISTGAYVTWNPNYINGRSYQVALVGLRAGGSNLMIDMRLARFGYAPQPVELDLRILGYA